MKLKKLNFKRVQNAFGYIPSSFKLKELQNDKLQLDGSLCSSADFTLLQVWGGGGCVRH